MPAPGLERLELLEPLGAPWQLKALEPLEAVIGRRPADGVPTKLVGAPLRARRVAPLVWGSGRSTERTSGSPAGSWGRLGCGHPIRGSGPDHPFTADRADGPSPRLKVASVDTPGGDASPSPDDAR